MARELAARLFVISHQNQLKIAVFPPIDRQFAMFWPRYVSKNGTPR
jgi:hypothetical protein